MGKFYKSYWSSGVKKQKLKFGGALCNKAYSLRGNRVICPGENDSWLGNPLKLTILLEILHLDQAKQEHVWREIINYLFHLFIVFFIFELQP